jgi:ribosomal protein S18 acetylase RimI-like enzyme
MSEPDWVAAGEPIVDIARGLPDELRGQAAALFEEAFGDKMRLAIRDRRRRMAFMERAMHAGHLVVASHEHQLLGMAGLSSKGPPYEGGLIGNSWDPRPYRDLLGWFGAAWAMWGLRLAEHTPRDDEIYVDGIAVAPAWRSRGIGRRLLAEIGVIARAQGKDYVRLDVVDTNPRARALYERVGYKVTREESYRLMRRWTGYGSIISMEQSVRTKGWGEP